MSASSLPPSLQRTHRRSRPDLIDASARRAVAGSLLDPPQRPALDDRLPGSVTKAAQRTHHRRALGLGNTPDDPRDLLASPPRHRIHDATPGRRQRQRDLATIRRRNRSTDQPLGHETITHPRRGRDVHPENICERTRMEWTAAREHDQSPKLRQRHITVDITERTRGNPHQDPRRTQHPIHDIVDLTAIRPTPRTRSGTCTTHVL